MSASRWHISPLRAGDRSALLTARTPGLRTVPGTHTIILQVLQININDNYKQVSLSNGQLSPASHHQVSSRFCWGKFSASKENLETPGLVWIRQLMNGWAKQPAIQPRPQAAGGWPLPLPSTASMALGQSWLLSTQPAGGISEARGEKDPKGSLADSWLPPTAVLGHWQPLALT